MLDVGAHDPGGGLRAERPRLGLFGARRDPEQLLLDDVRHLADAALEDLGLFDEGRLDLAVAVPGGKLRGGPFEARPGDPLGGQDVAGAPRGLEARHQGRTTGTSYPSIAASAVMSRRPSTRAWATSMRSNGSP